MKKILLIGGSGYIGSYLYLKLRDKYEITNIDLNWFSKDIMNIPIDYKNIDSDYLKKFDVIILLAGHSSVKMCQNDMVSSFKNNVSNFIELLSKVSKEQKIIYASSSSVYGITDSIVDENCASYVPNNYYDLTKQIIDLYSSKSDLNFYGLRFGTVNGWSPNLRVDIMINSMVHSAITDGHIKLYVKDIMRPILGINDLVSAVDSIIQKENSTPGIYNLSSFNSTSEQIANSVSQKLNVPILEYNVSDLEKITNVKLQTSAYNFAIDSTKFCKEFNFTFKENVESITESIVNDYENCEKNNRNDLKKYE